MANVIGTTTVAEPARSIPESGLLHRAEVRESNGHELMGFDYEVDVSVSTELVAGDLVTCERSALRELDDELDFQRSETGFMVYRGVVCSTFGGGVDQYTARAQSALELGEEYAVERHIFDTVLAERAVDVTPGAAVKPKRALGTLLELMGISYGAIPMIHSGRMVSTYLAGESLLDPKASDSAVTGGGTLVNGAGYHGLTGPGGVTAGPNERWLYSTGAILIYRSDIETLTATTHVKNERMAIAQRAYVVSIEGPILAIRTSLE